LREPFLNGTPDAPRHYFSGAKEAGSGEESARAFGFFFEKIGG